MTLARMYNNPPALRKWFRIDYVGLPGMLSRRKWLSESHLHGRAWDLEATIGAGDLQRRAG